MAWHMAWRQQNKYVKTAYLSLAGAVMTISHRRGGGSSISIRQRLI